MREYLFRGMPKDTTDSEWKYGSLIVNSYGTYIQVEMIATDDYGNTEPALVDYEVIPETVGQCAGLREDYYEGDVVEFKTTGINMRPDTETGVVCVIDGCFTVKFDNAVYDKLGGFLRTHQYVKVFTVNHAIKVIGNIHDKAKAEGE